MKFERKKYFIWVVLVLLMVDWHNAAIKLESKTKPVQEDNTQIQAETTKNDTTDTRKLKTYQCDRSMLLALGFMGYQEPVKQKLDMCLDIDFSCCTEEDQLEIYNNWIFGKERDDLIARMAANQKVYVDFLEALEKVADRAKKTSNILTFKKTSNCRIMSERILKFQIKYISTKLKDAIAMMHDFFLDTYSGFYCSLCDGKNINFISVENKKFILQKKVCKKMAEHVLQPLIYLNVHITNLLNLISKFLVSCDYKGRFKNSVPPLNLKFTVSQNMKSMLTKCKVALHGSTWFENCLPLCKKFSVTEYSRFFEPNKSKLLKYTKFIYKKLGEIKRFSMIDYVEEDVNQLDLVIKKPRLLAEDKAKEKRKLKKKASKSDSEEYLFKEDPFHDRNVFKSARESGIAFSFFTIEYKAKGMDLTEIGKTNAINETNFDNLKRRMIDAAKEKGIEEERTERKLKAQASILTHTLLLLGLTLFNLLG